MSSQSPAVLLYSSDGYEALVVANAAIPANTRGILFDGSDGTNARNTLVDTSGRLNIVGAAASGAAPAGNPLYVGASVTTGVPTYTTGTVGALSLTTAGLLRIDGTGGIFNTSAIAGTGTTTPTFAELIGGAVTTAAPTYTNGQMDPFSLTTGGLLRIDGVYPVNATTPTSDATFVAGAVTTASPTYTTGQMSALSLDTSGNLRSVVVGSGTAGTPSTGVVTIQGITGGTPIPVSGTFVVDKSTTGTLTSVAGSVTSVTFLASNANRVGAAFFNDGGSTLYLALSATAASTTAYTIKILPNSYYDMSGLSYTGQVNGIWNGTNSNARITEWT
jgi:hypothetical protein